MDFKLILVPETPDKYLLKYEKPLSGLDFITQAGACLRRNLDTKTKMRHVTLGTVAQYTISVPQALAIESTKFQSTDTVYLPCEENVLAKYIFYGACIGKTGTMRAVYPYYTDEVVLTSYIDELTLLDVWRTRNFPDKFTINLDSAYIPLVDDPDGDIQDASIGDLALDDLLH